MSKKITMTLDLGVIGKPRMTQSDKWKRRPCVIRYREWADELRRQFNAALYSHGYSKIDPADVLDFSWTAFIEMPDSWSKKKKASLDGKLHRSKPDRDNCDKAILDVLFKEDSGIASGTIRKVWSCDRMSLIIIITLGEE